MHKFQNEFQKVFDDIGENNGYIIALVELKEFLTTLTTSLSTQEVLELVLALISEEELRKVIGE